MSLSNLDGQKYRPDYPHFHWGHEKHRQPIGSKYAELEFQNQLLQSNRNNPMTTHDTSQDFQAAQPLTQTPAQHS
jgi:hypothetical protein